MVRSWSFLYKNINTSFEDHPNLVEKLTYKIKANLEVISKACCRILAGLPLSGETGKTHQGVEGMATTVAQRIIHREYSFAFWQNTCVSEIENTNDTHTVGISGEGVFYKSLLPSI